MQQAALLRRERQFELFCGLSA